MNPAITHQRPEQSTTRATPHAPSGATHRRALDLIPIEALTARAAAPDVV